MTDDGNAAGDGDEDGDEILTASWAAEIRIEKVTAVNAVMKVFKNIFKN